MASPARSPFLVRTAARACAAVLWCGLLLAPATAGAQSSAPAAAPPGPDSPSASPSSAQPLVVNCASKPGERQDCAADTSRGVVLTRSYGEASCLLGRTWGYDATAIWVSDGCSGEFSVGGSDEAATAAGVAPAGPGGRGSAPRVESWGEFEPGDGFLVGRNSVGELAISAYALVRYLNQTPAEDTFTDHLGNVRTVDGRNDIFPHRVIIWFKGWMGRPQLVYNVALWTVNTTNQVAIFGNIGYQFSRRFNLYAGINGNPGTRSLQGSHPYWLGHDRVMADEFFRPYFGSGAWAQGEVVPGLWYNAMIGNSNSALDIKATQLDRTFTRSASMWWMPTTREFGPKGGYGDWERHEKLATRFGFSASFSPEQRYTNADTGAAGNTTLRLADSINVFDTGALAPGVTVDGVDFSILSFDAGLKYRGFFLQTEIYNRWLDHFSADGPLPVSSVHDTGFYVQAAFYPVPKRLELYGVTSQVYGDADAGFGHSWEYGGGANFYPAATRNHRFNLQVLNVHKSPVNSTFGYYVGGQTGTTASVAFNVFF